MASIGVGSRVRETQVRRNIVFERIVAGVSRTDTARSVGHQAVELANELGADLHLVSSYEPHESKERPVERHLSALLDSLAASTRGPVQTYLLPGDPAEAILQIAGQVDADLIVVGNKGMKGTRRVLGSVPNTLTHRSSCSVLVLATT